MDEAEKQIQIENIQSYLAKRRVMDTEYLREKKAASLTFATLKKEELQKNKGIK